MKRKFRIGIMKLDPPYVEISIRIGLREVSIDVPVIFIPRLTVWKYDPKHGGGRCTGVATTGTAWTPTNSTTAYHAASNTYSSIERGPG